MIIALAVGGLACIAIIYILLRAAPSNETGEGRERGSKAALKEGLIKAGTAGQSRTCPLCQCVLDRGQRVKSDISPGKGDRIMRIFGCPACWPKRAGSAPRVCPVCGKELAPEAHLLARYFEKPGRNHVHVLGCSSCRRSFGGSP